MIVVEVDSTYLKKVLPLCAQNLKEVKREAYREFDAYFENNIPKTSGVFWKKTVLVSQWYLDLEQGNLQDFSLERIVRNRRPDIDLTILDFQQDIEDLVIMIESGVEKAYCSTGLKRFMDSFVEGLENE